MFLIGILWTSKLMLIKAIGAITIMRKHKFSTRYGAGAATSGCILQYMEYLNVQECGMKQTLGTHALLQLFMTNC